MAQSRLQLGCLVPLEDSDAESRLYKGILLFEGFNMIGRSDLPAASKQVSRKHISIHASDGVFQLTVEGQNPVVLRRNVERQEVKPRGRATIHVGDILELIPGKYAFKLLEKPIRNSNKPSQLLAKRKRQELEDESLARALQAIEDDGAGISGIVEGEGDGEKCLERPAEFRSPSCSNKGDSSHKATQGSCPITFQLLRVRGLAAWANQHCVGIQDVIEGNVVFALLSNYMVDLDWLLSACPLLNRVPQVVIVHGESGGALERLKAGKPSHWLLHKPPLPLSFGTHHSKAILLLYPTGVRVIVHTANLIYVDWNNKTQGLWMQDFPYKDEADKHVTSPFEEDLVEYLDALKWNGCTCHFPNLGMTRINASFFRRFNYSSAKVRLIASVPGYHQGEKLRKWGHMKLRSILETHDFDDIFVKSPLVYQFSSLGSLDEKWLSEFCSSMSSGSTFKKKLLGPGSFQIIWPSVEDVRCSIEGYGAGNAIPSPLKNVEKDFLKKYWAKWHAEHTGRSRAMPHFKSYVRYNGQDLAWFLLTSANLSKAAWGALQKNGSQLMIRSYELGVLFLPSTHNTRTNFSCTSNKTGDDYKPTEEQNTKLVTTCYNGHNEGKSVLRFPIPYKLPPERYSSEDIPWSWDRQYFKLDTYGELWPREVKLYGTKENR